MAKKLAKIQGLHNVFEPVPYFIQDIALENDTRIFYDEDKNIIASPVAGEVYYVVDHYMYDMVTFVSAAADLVSTNTVIFATADAEDAEYTIGGGTITEGNKYIIAKGNVYAKISSATDDPETEPWRPILVNDTVVASGDTPASVNMKSNSEYLFVSGTLNTDEVAITFNIDYNGLQAAISESLNLAPVAFSGSYNDLTDLPGDTGGVGNGELTVAVGDVDVYSETATDNKVTLKPNSITTDGSFTANQSEEGTINVNYTGNADRADWHVDQDFRRDNINNSAAKKFIYAEPMLEYFQAASFPAANSIRPDKINTISQDSIVFITCGTGIPLGSATTNTDKEYFQNPEFEEGTRWIWTQGKLFSANSWMPIYTQPYEGMDIYGISPVISREGGRLILRGGGNVTIDNEQDGKDHIIIINGTGSGATGTTMITGTSPIRATVNQSGVWTISIDETNIIKWGYIN